MVHRNAGAAHAHERFLRTMGSRTTGEANHRRRCTTIRLRTALDPHRSGAFASKQSLRALRGPARPQWRTKRGRGPPAQTPAGLGSGARSKCSACAPLSSRRPLLPGSTPPRPPDPHRRPRSCCIRPPPALSPARPPPTTRAHSTLAGLTSPLSHAILSSQGPVRRVNLRRARSQYPLRPRSHWAFGPNRRVPTAPCPPCRGRHPASVPPDSSRRAADWGGIPPPRGPLRRHFGYHAHEGRFSWIVRP
jgi:hypothetical protein